MAYQVPKVSPTGPGPARTYTGFCPAHRKEETITVQVMCHRDEWGRVVEAHESHVCQEGLLLLRRFWPKEGGPYP